MRPWNRGAVPEIFGNKPATERERALGKGRGKTDKSVLPVSFNLRLKLKKKKNPVRLLQTGGTMQTVCLTTHQMPSVCLEGEFS